MKLKLKNYKQLFRCARMIAKWSTLPFVLAGVFLFILQFAPTYVGHGIELRIFIAGGVIWALDTLWSICHGAKEIGAEIKHNRATNWSKIFDHSK